MDKQQKMFTVFGISVLALTLVSHAEGKLPKNLPPLPQDIEDIFVTYCRSDPHENEGEHLEGLGIINSKYKDWTCEYVDEKQEKEPDEKLPYVLDPQKMQDAREGRIPEEQCTFAKVIGIEEECAKQELHDLMKDAFKDALNEANNGVMTGLQSPHTEQSPQTEPEISPEQDKPYKDCLQDVSKTYIECQEFNPRN